MVETHLDLLDVFGGGGSRARLTRQWAEFVGVRDPGNGGVMHRVVAGADRMQVSVRESRI